MRSTSISCIVSLDDPKIYYAAVKPSPISRLLKSWKDWEDFQNTACVS